MGMEHWWNDTDRGETEMMRQKLDTALFLLFWWEAAGRRLGNTALEVKHPKITVPCPLALESNSCE
jgi:hypothetical protein